MGQIINTQGMNILRNIPIIKPIQYAVNWMFNHVFNRMFNWTFNWTLNMRLYIACRFGDALVLEHVLNDAKANTKIYNVEYVKNGLYVACRYGQLKPLICLLNYNVPIDKISVIIAACHGNTDILRHMYSVDKSNITDVNDLAFYACLCDQKDVVKWLMSINHIKDYMQSIRATDEIYIYNNSYLDYLPLVTTQSTVRIKNIYGYHLDKHIPRTIYNVIKHCIKYNRKQDIARLLLKYE